MSQIVRGFEVTARVAEGHLDHVDLRTAGGEVEDLGRRLMEDLGRTFMYFYLVLSSNPKGTGSEEKIERRGRVRGKSFAIGRPMWSEIVCKMIFGRRPVEILFSPQLPGGESSFKPLSEGKPVNGLRLPDDPFIQKKSNNLSSRSQQSRGPPSEAQIKREQAGSGGVDLAGDDYWESVIDGECRKETS